MDRVALWGTGDTVVVRLDLRGKAAGTVYLLGRIEWDESRRAVLVRDLDYTLASASAMTRLKATLGAPLIRRALNQAVGGGTLEVGAQLDEARAMLTRELNQPLAEGVRVSGAIRAISVDRLIPTSTSFLVRVLLTGDARITVQ